MKRPIPLKIVIAAYSILSLLIFAASAYASYVGWVADHGSLTEYQKGFISGMGFDAKTFRLADAGSYAGTMAPTFLVALLSILCLLRRWIGAFFIIFAIDAVLFTGGIGYVFKFVTLALLLTPSSQKHFKKVKTVNELNSNSSEGQQIT